MAEQGARGRRTSINTAYKMLTRTEYTLEELQGEEKPEGVDPSRLEDYLSEEEFMVWSISNCARNFCKAHEKFM